jgi:hypothetical protein
MKIKTDIQPSESVLTEDEAAVDVPPAELPAGEHTEKGSLRSMWELLMQLRVLLPYLTRLVPLLDRGLVKAAPDLTEFRKDLQDVHTGSLDIGIQVRNQALQLEKIEEQTLRLRELSERSQKEIRELSAELHSLAGWVRVITILISLALAILILLTVLAVLQLSHAPL